MCLDGPQEVQCSSRLSGCYSYHRGHDVGRRSTPGFVGGREEQLKLLLSDEIWEILIALKEASGI